MIKLLIGDLHIKESNIDLIDKFFQTLHGYLENNKIDQIVFLGDIYNQRAIIRTEHQRLLIRWLGKLRDRVSHGIDIVVGNHDMDSLEATEKHSLDVLPKIYDNIRVHSSHTMRDRELYLPYTKDFEGVKSVLKKFGDSINYVYCHLPINGFNMSPTVVEDNGVDVEAFTGVKHNVFAGHFHAPQQKGKVVYPGSVLINSFAESGMNPKLILLDTVNHKFDCLDLKMMAPWLPLFHTVIIKKDQPFDLDSIQYNLVDNYRFVLHFDTYAEAHKMGENIRKNAPQGTHIQLQYKLSGKIGDVTIPERLTAAEAFQSYVSKMYTDSPLKSEILECGLRLIKDNDANL